MDDIDRLLEELLNDRRLREGSAFSERIYSGQPIIQTGRQLERWRQEHAQEAPGEPGGQRRAEQERQRQKAKAERNRARRQRGARLGREDETTRSIPSPRWRQALDTPSKAHRHDVIVPERYLQMRSLASSAGGGGHLAPYSYSMRSHRLFFEQAKFMEDFEDDYGGMADFEHYYPTYAVMDIEQLRSYFSWRRKVRDGNVEPASVSYAFLYVYELLCGIGIQAGRQGYDALMRFWRAFSAHGSARDTTFDTYLRRWTHDYAIYHGIPEVLGENAHSNAVGTLLEAEAATLARRGLARKATRPNEMVASPPDPSDLLDALARASRYRLERSRFVKDHPKDAQAVIVDVFEALVEHCSRRRKTDFVEGLFGQATAGSYTMYPSAVFFDPNPPDGRIVTLGIAETYRCVRGTWTRTLAYRRMETSRELGHILRATDKQLREAYGYGHPIKLLKSVPKYVQRIIDEAIGRHVARQREEEARRVTIDLAKLQDIRSNAAATRESLLTDDEREEHYSVVNTNIYTNESPFNVNISNNNFLFSSDIDKDKNMCTLLGSGEGCEIEAIQDATALTDVERDILTALLDGDTSGALHTVGSARVPASVIVDSINEKLFDAIGDTVIELVGDAPAIVGDYEQEVRGIVEHA